MKTTLNNLKKCQDALEVLQNAFNPLNDDLDALQDLGVIKNYSQASEFTCEIESQLSYMIDKAEEEEEKQRLKLTNKDKVEVCQMLNRLPENTEICF